MSAYAEFTDPSADDIVTRLGEMGVSYNHSQVTSKMEQLGLISSPSCQVNPHSFILVTFLHYPKRAITLFNYTLISFFLFRAPFKHQNMLS